MTEQYPLCPSLPEAGKEEAQALINNFKDEITKIAENAIGNMYCDVAVHIESDSWTNYRNKMMDGKYLTFILGEEVYGIEILKAREIIGLMGIQSYPRHRIT